MTTYKAYNVSETETARIFGTNYAEQIAMVHELVNVYPYQHPGSFEMFISSHAATIDYPYSTQFKWVSNYANGFAAETALSRDLRCYPNQGYLENEIYNQLFITPPDFEIGFIVEETLLQFVVWNPFPYSVATLTDIQVTGGSDSVFEDIDLPYQINRAWSRTFNITLSATGGAQQDTVYKLIIDGVEYLITITGIRIIPFKFDHDWAEDFTITYGYESAIYKTEKFSEQRRPLRSKCWRELDVLVVNSGFGAGRIFNILEYGKDKLFGVPVYNEPMYPEILISGEYTATLKNSTADLYNLNELSEYVIVLDALTYKAEIKKIDTISDYEIEFVNSISNDFATGRTVIYPCLIATITNSSYASYNDELTATKITFGEFG